MDCNNQLRNRNKQTNLNQNRISDQTGFSRIKEREKEDSQKEQVSPENDRCDFAETLSVPQSL